MKLVYLSPVRWDSFAQRPHFLIREFLKTTRGQALWIDPYPGRLPRLSDLRRVLSPRLPGSDQQQSIRVLHPKALPLDAIRGSSVLNRRLFWRHLAAEISTFCKNSKWVLGVGRPSNLAVHLLDVLNPTSTFYDAMDDFPEFYKGISHRSAIRQEQRITSNVDHIYVTSSFLKSKFDPQHNAVILIPNACDSESLPPPERTESEVIFGYIGTIGSWFDWDIIRSLAELHPRCRIQLIGPIFCRIPAKLPPNVELLGACSQSDVGSHLSRFSLGIIPFKLNKLTLSVDPIKYYEYRAMGLPVLSTRFGEMSTRDSQQGVFFFDEFGSLKQATAAALSFREKVSAVHDFRERNSWSQRVTNWELPHFQIADGR